ncbi:hypothetical protein QNH48_28460 [Neobacillus sp. YX16]|nr:hypothetical protein [Neobacillus sp. YX16]WHZ02807.1 hypothetical protein QNH48_28460 [Neobacillus sp. YX16]
MILLDYWGIWEKNQTVYHGSNPDRNPNVIYAHSTRNRVKGRWPILYSV